MIGDTAPGTRSGARVAAVITLLLWAGGMVAQEPRVSVKESPLPEGADKRGLELARWPSYNVTLRNPFKEKIYVRSLVIEVSKAEVDTRSQPLYDLMPFLDFMVVKANNLGWGPADPGSLRICRLDAALEGVAPDKAAPRQAKTLDLLLGLAPNTHDLSSPTGSGYLFAQINPKAEPFRFISAGRVDLTGSRPPPQQLEDGPVACVADPVTVFKTENAAKGRLPAKYSASGSFQGEFVRKEGEKKKVPFLARRLQKLELTEESSFVNQLLGADLEGGLYRDWLLDFGNSASVAKAVSESAIIFGATIDLGEGTKPKIPVRAVLEIEGGEEQTFSLTFVSSKSLRCTIQADLEYQFAKSPWTKYRFIQKPRLIETKVPRAPNLGWAESRAFLRELRTKNPAVRDRARKALEAGLPGKARKATTVAGAASQARQFAQALWLLSEEAPDDRTVKQAFRDFVAWAREFPASDENHSIVIEYFPLLCRASPPDAVRMALASQKDQDDALIACGLCMPEFLKEVESHAEEVRRTFDGAKKDIEFWTPPLIALAALLRDPEVPKLFKGDDYDVPRNWAALAWAGSKQPSADIDGLLRARLKLKTITPDTAKGMIDAFRLTKNERFWDEVHAYANRVSKDQDARSHIESLLACLRYFQGFNRASLKPLLEDLERSPLGSDVQKAARQLLGKSER